MQTLKYVAHHSLPPISNPCFFSLSTHEECSCLSAYSIWKPLYGPLTDWPLSVCDSRSISVPRDCIATDVVEREGFTENYQVYYHEDMQFCYLSGQLASEVILFRQTDTEEGCGTGMLVHICSSNVVNAGEIENSTGSSVSRLI